MIDNQNTFYGEFTDTSFKVIFNDSKSAIKSFHTINYEGSQARVNQYTGSTEIDATGNQVITPGYTNVNDGEYYNLNNKYGWYVDSFNTDMQTANVPEFINKENKWFNKIKGLATNLDYVINHTSDFSIQGLGVPTNIEIEEPPTPPVPQYISLVPVASPINEGQTFNWILTTSNVPIGTTINFSIITDATTIDLNDLSFFINGELTCGSEVDENIAPLVWNAYGEITVEITGDQTTLYQANLPIGICEDLTTEGIEYVTAVLNTTDTNGDPVLDVDGNQLSSSIAIIDSSVSPPTPVTLTVQNDQQASTPDE